MYRIHSDFTAGNIVVISQNETDVVLENELRDTTTDWMYWAFCIEGAENLTLTFHFQDLRLGYWGPAVSHDLVNWHWSHQVEGNTFTYTFGPDESKVYFAHHMLYHPARFLSFIEGKGLKAEEFCVSRKGRSVPCIHFGSGSRQLILTARHHACESTGSYVLEGVLEGLLQDPLPDTRVFCVPFMDYDGVVDGDQGKNRYPYDHNSDYFPDKPSIYPETAALRRFVEAHGGDYTFDFHSPWHKGDEHDNVFFVQNGLDDPARFARINRFAELLEASLTPEAMKYCHANDYPPAFGWNFPKSTFTLLMTKDKRNNIALGLESTYYGTPDSIVTGDGLVELGRCFTKALHRYIGEQ